MAVVSMPRTPSVRLRTRVRGVDLRCSGCGYGVVVRITPERCPMCGGETWERVLRRGRLYDDADAFVRS